MLHANIFELTVPNYMALMCHIHFVDKLRHPVQFCLTCDIVCHVRVDGCGNQKRLPFKVLSYVIFNYSRIRMDRFHKPLKTPEVAGCPCHQPPSLHQDTTDSWLTVRCSGLLFCCLLLFLSATSI